MHTDGRDTSLHQPERHILRAQFPERVKDDRVMGDDGFAVFFRRFRHHFRGDVQRHQHPAHSAAAVHQKAGVIPVFGQFQRRDLFHCFIKLLYCCHASVPSFKIASISCASGVPSGTPRRIRGSFAFCHAA